MIAPHHEPKLLPRDAVPIWDRRGDTRTKKCAIAGSAQLRDAMRKALGVDPWRDPPKPDSHPKVVRRRRKRAQKVTPDTSLWKIRMRRRAEVLNVQAVSCEHFGISIDELTGSRGNLKMAHKRHVAMVVARITTQASYPDIGGCFKRDHSSVMNGCSRVSEFDADVIAICAKLA